MLDLIHESGWGAYLVLLLAVGGVIATVTIGRKRSRPAAIAAAFAVALLAAGALGSAAGQHKVDRMVTSIPAENVQERLKLLTEGTRETSGNLMLAGLCGLGLMALGGGLALRSKPE